MMDETVVIGLIFKMSSYPHCLSFSEIRQKTVALGGQVPLHTLTMNKTADGEGHVSPEGRVMQDWPLPSR